MSLLIFIAILVALIWVHELGHFLAAKFFKIRVDEFAIGFPPKLLSVQWGETRYSFNLLLVGGFVKIHGEDPSSADATAGKPGDTRSMANKPRYVQALVVVAGVAMNLLFGWLALSAGFMVGLPTSATNYDGFGTVRDAHPTIVGVLPGSPATLAGLLPGDTIVSVETGTAKLDTQSTGTAVGAQQIQQFIADHQDESVILTVERTGAEVTTLARGVEGLVEGRKAIGIQLDDVGVLQLPPHLALLQGAVSAKELTVATAQGLGSFFGQLARGAANWGDVAGPVGIASVGAGAVNDGFASAVLLTALISINLALINLVPIPGLDGGRLLIIAIEGVLRRPVSPRLVFGLSVAGFLLLAALMIAVTYHDIVRLVG